MARFPTNKHEMFAVRHPMRFIVIDGIVGKLASFSHAERY
jgi:hypothetical protein